MFDSQKIKADFPLLQTRRENGKPLVYLDSAATTQKPRQVLDAQRRFYEELNANVHRGAYALSHEATLAWEEAHDKVAKFVGAKSRAEVAFMRNATEALNAIALAWGDEHLHSGDEVVVTLLEHHSNLVPWQRFEARGVKLTLVPVKSDGTLDLDAFKAAVTRKTKIVSVTHQSNVLGTINPVRELGKITHDSGALFVVDAAQSVPHMPVNFRDIDADFLAFSGHKMLAPTGTGALVGKQARLEEMQPFLRGGEMIKEVHTHDAVWNDLPWKFEAGTPDAAGGIALGAAIDYLNKLSLGSVRQHEIELTQYALDKLDMIGSVTAYGPRDLNARGGVVSFSLKGAHPHDVATLLDAEGIAVRSGFMCAQPLCESLAGGPLTRASFYIYNSKADVDAFAAQLAKIAKVFA